MEKALPMKFRKNKAHSKTVSALYLANQNLSCNNLRGQTQTNTVDNAADQQDNNSGICSPSQDNKGLCKNFQLIYPYIHVWHIIDPHAQPH